jgi:hypothetical protein
MSSIEPVMAPYVAGGAISGAAIVQDLCDRIVGRVELTAFYAKYIRAFVKSLQNSVYVTILATH